MLSPWDIVRLDIVLHGFLSLWGFVPLGFCPPGLLSHLDIVPLVFCPHGILSPWVFVLLGFCPLGYCPMGFCPVGFCPRTDFTMFQLVNICYELYDVLSSFRLWWPCSSSEKLAVFLSSAIPWFVFGIYWQYIKWHQLLSSFPAVRRLLEITRWKVEFRVVCDIPAVIMVRGGEGSNTDQRWRVVWDTWPIEYWSESPVPL